MTTPSSTSDRRTAERITPADHPTGHDLIAVDGWRAEWVPTDRTTRPSEDAPFWRCRACGAERRRPDEFEAVCPGGPAEPIATDGGSSVEDLETERAESREFTVQFLDFGPAYRVIEADGTAFVVDIEAGTCRCDGRRDAGGECAHLRRARRALATGELPGPDGRFVA